MTSKAKVTDKDIVSDLIEATSKLLSVETTDKEMPIYSHEVWFTLPAIKKSLSLFLAIQRELDKKALVASAVLLRSLIKTVTNYCFVMGLPKKEGFYEKYLESGRLRVYKKGKGWQKVTVAQQIEYSSKVMELTQLQELYDNCSNLVHPSADNIKLVLTGDDKDDGTVIMQLAPDEEHIEDKVFNDIYVQAFALMISLYKLLLQEIEAKKQHTEKEMFPNYKITKAEPY